MEYKYPIIKEDGKDYTATELYGKLANENGGHYLLGTNDFWHGGIHFSTPNISEKTLVQAVAEGTIIAYRINKEYETIPSTRMPEGYQFSTGFCIIKHSIPIESSDQLKQEKAKLTTVQNVQDNKKLFEGKRVSVQSAERAYRIVEGITKDNAGTYAKGTELEVIRVGDEQKSDYYFAKVKKVQTDSTITEKEYYVAFLDKEGHPLTNNEGTQIFEILTDKEVEEVKISENSDNKGAETDNKNEVLTEGKIETPEEEPNPNVFNLEFYSLYMHLSAYADYELAKEDKKRPSYWEGTVTAVVKNANGIDIWQTLESNKLKTKLGTINLNNRFTFDSTKTKTITSDNRTLLIAECTAIGAFTFRGEGDQPKGKFWTTVDKESITRTNVEPTIFNTVVPCNTKIIAGEPIGYLGTYETPSQTAIKISKKQVHIEIFTPYLTTVEFLLNNPFKLAGKKYIKVPKGTKLLSIIPSNQTPSIPLQNKEDEYGFEDYTTKQDHYVEVNDLIVEKQLKTNEEYYKLAIELHTGYIKKVGLEEIDQYNWTKLGFKTVEEPNKDSDGYLKSKVMPEMFQQVYSQIVTRKDGKLPHEELREALRDQNSREQWSKIIALHPSEWRMDTKPIVKKCTELLTNPKASEDEQKAAEESLKQLIEKLNKLVFLEQVAPPIPPMLYHFHPVTFVEYLNENKKVCPIDPKYRSHFVIHSTAGNMSKTQIKRITDKSKGHKYIMKDGEVIEVWPFTKKDVWATKTESRNEELKGQMFHVELNYKVGDLPTDAQYNSLADLYIEASNIEKCWPIIVPHIEVDRGITGGHSDPTDFNYNKFYEILRHKNVPIDKIPHFSHDRYWSYPFAKMSQENDKYSWPPKLSGNPHAK